MDEDIFIIYSNYLADVERKMWYGEYNTANGIKIEDQFIFGTKSELDNNTNNLNDIFYNPKQYHMEGQIDYTKTNMRYFEGVGIPIANSFTNMPPNTIRPGRRVGNTTRLADHSIDLLFEGRIVAIHDHHREYIADKTLFDTVLDRLKLEHRGAIKLDRLVIDRTRLMLYIKPEEYGANKETTTATQA
jgi:hypothetical protein